LLFGIISKVNKISEAENHSWQVTNSISLYIDRAGQRVIPGKKNEILKAAVLDILLLIFPFSA
jgi:hypothetical protein